jgi:nucleotide-binding universal stress UspA family protein
MRKVLIPTDFSANSLHAIAYAERLFEKEDCLFHILHIRQEKSKPLGKDSHEKRKHTHLEMSEEASEKELQKLIKHLKTTNKSLEHSFEGLVVTDLLLNALTCSIIDLGIEYVFMGRKGNSTNKNTFMGSNTLNLIKNMPLCPIIIVPKNFEFNGLNQIAFASDLKHRFQPVELLPLVELSILWNSELLIEHIKKEKKLSKVQKDNKQLLSELLKELPSTFEDIEAFSPLPHVLNQLAVINQNIGLLALMNGKYGFFQELFHEDVIKKVIPSIGIPLLILPEVDL